MPHDHNPSRSTNHNPLFKRVAQAYKDQIISGEIGKGERLPSRREMMRVHNLSRDSADKIMNILISEGYVGSLKPRTVPVVLDTAAWGTTPEDRMASYRQTGEALAKNEHSEIIKLGWITCPPEIALRFGITADDEIFMRQRVTYKNNTALGFSTSYYLRETVDVTPELTQKNSIRKGSRELAAERLAMYLPRDIENDIPGLKDGTLDPAKIYLKYFITSRHADKEEAKYLKLSPYSAPHVVTQEVRIARIPDGRIVEVGVKVTQGSRVLRYGSQ